MQTDEFSTVASIPSIYKVVLSDLKSWHFRLYNELNLDQNILMKLFLIVLIFVISSTALAEEFWTKEKILARGRTTTPRYVLGGTVGTVFGFGSGHAINDTYDQYGKWFTWGEIGAVGGVIVFASAAALRRIKTDSETEKERKDRHSDSNLYTNLALVSLVGFVGLRLWEIFDVWYRPIVLDRAYDGFIKEQVAFGPIAAPDGRFGLGLVYQY